MNDLRSHVDSSPMEMLGRRGRYDGCLLLFLAVALGQVHPSNNHVWASRWRWQAIKREIKMMEAREIDSYAVSSNDVIDSKRDG